MGQIKTQGNITIIDTTDIESIVVEYARNQSTSTPPTSGWSTTRPAWAQGYYIWQRTRIHKSGTQTSQDTFGDAVCLTGSTGQTGAAGRSLTSMVTQYTTAANSVTITQSNMGQYTWTNNVPTYNSSTPAYWVRVTNTYSNPSSTEYIIYKDNGITDAMATAVTANSIAQHAQEDADGALGQASVSIKEIYRVWYRTDSATAPAKPTTHVTQTSNDVTKTWTKNKPIDNTNNRYYFYCDETITNGGISSWTEPVLDTSNLSQYEVNALSAKLKNFWWDSNGAHAASGIGGNSVTENTVSTYGYNSLMGVTGFSIGYNAAKVIDLKTTPSPASLDMYQPPSISGTTVTQGAKTISLSGNALTFYNPSTGNAQLIIGANGTLQSGNYSRGSDSKFSSNGTKIDLVNGDIITKYFRVSQGLESGLTAGVYVHGTIEALDGTIGTDSTNYWEIGNGIDYNLNSTAKIVGHGSSYIQLGDSSTWRLATNRIHTGWYTSGDSLLHFPAIDSKYWDFGIHAPTAATEKLLYIRKSKANTSASNVLTNLLYDIDDSYATPQWDYMFYISANGSLYAKNLYVLDDNGNPIQIGGTDGVYLLKSGGTITGNLEVNGTLTKGGKTVTYLTSTPTNGQILVADGTSGSIKTSGYTIATSVPSGAIFTDKNVQTSQANTTKIYLAGTSTTGTTTGTLNFDSNVYLTTTAGTLHATTFEGNLSGTATKANQDGDGNVIKTTYLKLSGGNVTGPVTFGSSVSVDELTVGDLVVNGVASFTNNLQANTINGVAVGSNPKFTDNNTTYTFANGTNGFTVTPSGGDAQTVTVTPSISNNITGTGTRTSGYLAKFSGTNTITNGPAIGTGTTKFLREDGTWVVPGGTYSLPTASSSTLGGIKVGSGLSISDGVLSHTDTSSQASSSNSGRTYIQSITLDTYGHVTGLTTASESVTDTHYTTHLYAGKSDGNANAATTNGNTYLMVLDNTTVRDRRKISGSGAASVTSDANGNITINSPVAITGVSFANGTITFTKSDSTTIPITTDNFVITQASGATALVKLKSGSTTEYEGYSAGGATTAPVYFDTDGHPVAVTSIPASLISGSVTPTSHNHSQIITVGDQRSTATTPNDYVNALIFKGLKTKATIGSPSSDTYSYLIGLRGWSDSSGGRSHEIAFNNTGIFVRQESSSTANTWGSWYQIYTTGNKPTKSDVGLSNVANSDTTNASNITSGTLAKERLATSGATAGSYGDSAAQTPSYGSTFKVPYITVDTYGRVTSISEHTVKIPASDNTNTHRPIQLKGTEILGNNTTALNFAEGTNVTLSNDGGTITINSSYVNTDTKVNMKARGTTKAYVLGTTTSPTSSNQAIESVAETGVYFDTTAGKLVATTFSGSLSGNASTATTASKLGSSNVGAADRPIYLSAGSPNQTTYRMAATNANAISALGIDTNLDTGIWYVNGTNSTNLYSVSDGAAYVNKYSDSWIAQIYQDYRTGQIALRGKNNGTWQAWRKVLDSSNYTNYLGSVYVKTTGNEGVLGTKVFGSGTSYGSVTNNTTYTEKANINYDSTLEAIVFSFA